MTMPLSGAKDQKVEWKGNVRKEMLFSVSAVAFFFLSIVLCSVTAFLSMWLGVEQAAAKVTLFAFALSAVFSAVAAFFCFDASNPSAPDLMPPHDRRDLIEEIKNGNVVSIELYLKLRNLRGVSGFFQKIGLTGLPLSTIFMTLVFTFLAVCTTGEARVALFDLAKLTVGAFIGSFVAKQGAKEGGISDLAPQAGKGGSNRPEAEAPMKSTPP